MLTLYLSTFDLGVLIIFPVVLLTSGIALQYYILKPTKKNRQKESVSVKSAANISYYVMVGFAALIFLGVISPYVDKLPFLSQTRLAVTQAIMFVSLIAIAEEQFFRGFLTNYLSRSSVIFGIFGSAVVFGAFHLAVYGQSVSSLFYVLASGILLAWLGVHTGKLVVPMLIHLLNNVGVYLLMVVTA